MVAVRRQDRSAWWFAGGALMAAVLLFSALEARRRGVEQAGVQSSTPGAFAAPDTVPELVVPDLPDDPARGALGPWANPGDAEQQRSSSPPAPQTRTSTAPAALPSQPYPGGSPHAVPPPSPISSGEVLPATTPPQPIESPPSSAIGTRVGRIMAGRLESPATTVVQGTLINAVLETALDSTSPGQTRALVTRDVHGFDGTRVLIPRGSRLYGVYEANVAQGQKRAQIRWSRLLRPDGVSIALDSPAADPLGRAGVAARVDNHFLQRLGNALLGTASNVGSTLLTSSIGNSPVVVALPGSTQTATQAVGPSSSQITPTLTVRQGARITVFVQHDLDFSSVDAEP